MTAVFPVEATAMTVTGPIVLGDPSAATLLWTAKAGHAVTGSVKLVLEPQGIAQLRDLDLLTHETPHIRQTASARLLHAVADYCRERGILKLKVHRNSHFDFVPAQLTRFGFSDARRSNGKMQFYLDIYVPPKRRRSPVQSGYIHLMH